MILCGFSQLKENNVLIKSFGVETVYEVEGSLILVKLLRN